jgi:hypothetical protein
MGCGRVILRSPAKLNNDREIGKTLLGAKARVGFAHPANARMRVEVPEGVAAGWVRDGSPLAAGQDQGIGMAGAARKKYQKHLTRRQRLSYYLGN